MNKELFIHLGLPRSGSTSIQLSLERNIDLLHKKGFEVFSWGSVVGTFAKYLTYHAICNWNGKYKCNVWDTWKEYRESLHIQDLEFSEISNIVKETISTSPYPKIIVSVEELCGFLDCPDTPFPERILYKLTDIFNDFNKKTIIYFFRNQVDFLASLYQQQILFRGETASFDVFFDEFLPLCDWERIIDDTQTCLPGADIVVTTLEHAVKADGPFKRFCELVGISETENLQEFRGNVGVNTVLMPLIKTWNSFLSREEMNRLEKRFLKDVAVYEKNKPKFFPFTADHQRRIKEKFHESNRRLFQRFNIDDEAGFKEWAKPYLEPPPGTICDGKNDWDSAVETVGRYILLWMDKTKEENNRKNKEVRIASFSRGYIQSFIRFSYPVGEQVALYGAGSHTAIFLEELKRAGVTPLPVVVAKAPGRSSLEGMEVFDAETFDYGTIERVIISSRTFEDEIFAELLKKGIPRNKIIRLYGYNEK